MESYYIVERDQLRPVLRQSEQVVKVDNDIAQIDVKIYEDSEDMLRFSIGGINYSFANAYRRIMLSEVPTMAISKVCIHENESIIPEEQLANRLGLLPIKVDPKLFEFKSNKEEFEENPEDTIKFELKIEQPIRDKTIDVLSGHIVWKPLESQQQIHKNIKFVNDNIIVAKLGKGHSLDITMYATKGIGKYNSKFSPVGTVLYKWLPEIIFKSPIEGKEAHLLKECFSEGVIEIENKEDKDVAVVKAPYLYNCTRNYMMYPELAEKIEVRMKADYFIFEVETLGSLPSSDIFLEAISVLAAKAMNLSMIS